MMIIVESSSIVLLIQLRLLTLSTSDCIVGTHQWHQDSQIMNLSYNFLPRLGSSCIYPNNRIEQRVVGLTVHNDTLIVIVAQCLVCVCVCQMDSVFSVQPLVTIKVLVYHQRLLVIPLHSAFISSYLKVMVMLWLVNDVNVVHWTYAWFSGAVRSLGMWSYLSTLYLQPYTSRFYLFTVSHVHTVVFKVVNVVYAYIPMHH